MKELQTAKIKFPCEYPIRVIGVFDPDYKDFVLSVIRKHAEDFDGNTEIKASRNGKYISLKVIIRATGESQLKLLFEDLKASSNTQMVL